MADAAAISVSLLSLKNICQTNLIQHFSEAVARRCSVKTVYNLIKKETLAQVFSCEFSKTFKNILFYRTPAVAASDFSVQAFTTFPDHRLILLRIQWKCLTCIDETKTSDCILEDRSQRVIWNDKLEKLYTDTLELELRISNGRTLRNSK